MHRLFQGRWFEYQIFRNTQMNLNPTLLLLLAGGNSWAFLNLLSMMKPRGKETLNFSQCKVQLKGTLNHKVLCQTLGECE